MNNKIKSVVYLFVAIERLVTNLSFSYYLLMSTSFDITKSPRILQLINFEHTTKIKITTIRKNYGHRNQ